MKYENSILQMDMMRRSFSEELVHLRKVDIRAQGSKENKGDRTQTRYSTICMTGLFPVFVVGSRALLRAMFLAYDAFVLSLARADVHDWKQRTVRS
jgi:hypothetical protein